MAYPNQFPDGRCPIQHVLEIVGSKWAILILRELFLGNRRTHQFIEALPGISTKTLTARLRELESYGLVERTVFPEVPPRVEYALTAKGHEMQPVMVALRQLGDHWLAQDRYLRSMDSQPIAASKSISV